MQMQAVTSTCVTTPWPTPTTMQQAWLSPLQAPPCTGTGPHAASTPRPGTALTPGALKGHVAEGHFPAWPIIPCPLPPSQSVMQAWLSPRHQHTLRTFSIF